MSTRAMRSILDMGITVSLSIVVIFFFCGQLMVFRVDAEGCLPEDVDGYPYSGKAQALYGDHYPRLQALKKVYDPEMLFSKWFVITPA